VSDVEGRTERLSGLAHVASCSFLASRLAPSGQFWIALAGGVALARAGARHGLRAGYGASLAAIIQTVAMIGPARINGPLTQALNAPLVGRMQERGAPFGAVVAACLTIRLLHYIVLNVVFVIVVVGGLDKYVATYDKVAGWLPLLPTGTTAAVALTIAGGLVWGVFYSVIQVLAYRRAFERWPTEPPESDDEAADAEPPAPSPPAARGAFAIVLTAVALFVALLASTSWTVLGSVAGLLTVLWLATRAFDWPALRLGLALSAVFAMGALGPAIIGAVPWGESAPLAVRAALLVMVATWARAAARAEGIRRVARTVLAAVGAHEAARLTDELESDRRLAAAGRSLIERLREVPKEPLPMADALTAWVAAEAARHP
jgi:hypothetical protein